MAKKVIVIDGYIGSGGYSKQWVRNMLSGSDNSEVVVPISSLGGDVDHAINIHDQFAAQGNVTADFTGFNASGGTVIALGAKYSRMSKNSFYLIHKVMSWVDEFGYMNEDDIDALIQKLEKDKNENAKITLQVAQMYAVKSGKPVKDILNLMKQQTWLTADEAKTWRFVDEVYQPVKKDDPLQNVAMVAMIASLGYPLPARKESTTTTPATPSNGVDDEEGLFNRLLNRLLKVTPINKKPMKKQFVNVNKALKVDKLESTDEGIFLNEEQLESLDTCITTGITATAERDTARTEFTDAITAIDAIDPTVAAATGVEAKVLAIQAVIAKKPGAKTAEIDKDTDGDGGTPSENSFWDRFSRLRNEVKLKS
jgi:ATP-dependent Clp protease, protease subunit